MADGLCSKHKSFQTAICIMSFKHGLTSLLRSYVSIVSEGGKVPLNGLASSLFLASLGIEEYPIVDNASIPTSILTEPCAIDDLYHQEGTEVIPSTDIRLRKYIENIDILLSFAELPGAPTLSEKVKDAYKTQLNLLKGCKEIEIVRHYEARTIIR